MAVNDCHFFNDNTSLQGKKHCNFLIPSPCKIHEFSDDQVIKPSYNWSHDFLYVKDHKLGYGGNSYMSYTIHVTHLLQAKELLKLNHPTNNLMTTLYTWWVPNHMSFILTMFSLGKKEKIALVIFWCFQCFILTSWTKQRMGNFFPLCLEVPCQVGCLLGIFALERFLHCVGFVLWFFLLLGFLYNLFRYMKKVLVFRV